MGAEPHIYKRKGVDRMEVVEKWKAVELIHMNESITDWEGGNASGSWEINAQA